MSGLSPAVALPEGISAKLIRSAGIAAVALGIAIPVGIAPLNWAGVALTLMMIPLWRRGIRPAPFWPKAWAGFVGAAVVVFLLASDWKEGWSSFHGYGFLVYAYALWTLFHVAPEWGGKAAKGFVFSCTTVAALLLAQTVGLLDFMVGLLWSHGTNRAGLFTNPILTAEMLLLAMITGWFTLKGWRGWWPVMLLLLAGIVATGTRGVWVAVILMLPYMAATLWRGWRYWVGLAAVLALFGGALAMSHSAQDRMERAVGELQGAQDRGTMTRLNLWHGAWLLWQQHPVLGVGFGAFPQEVQALADKGEIGPLIINVHAHNVVMQWLAVQGGLGVLALLFLLAQPWWASPRLMHPGDPWVQARWVMLAVLLTGMTEDNLDWDAMMTAWSVCLVLAMAPLIGSSQKEPPAA